jgi:hypothetical protein
MVWQAESLGRPCCMTLLAVFCTFTYLGHVSAYMCYRALQRATAAENTYGLLRKIASAPRHMIL